jgi:glycosyltransferase involved in cell wall biosynthesis
VKTLRLRIGCCAETDEPGWRWISAAPQLDDLDWTFYSNIPQNALERGVRRPRLSRYRACRDLAAATRAGRFDLVVTHHPLVTCWTELFCRGRRPCPHVAYAFNFTRLPRGPRRSLMRRAFSSVERFVVFSQFERALYADYFRIPESRLEMVHWGVREPEAAAAPCDAIRGDGPADAICAVGSQARDYATLLEAMRRLPRIPLVLVARPVNLRGLAVPPNVTVRLDVPLSEAQAVIRRSRFMVLPLSSTQVPCGHVTLVTAMYCARAVLATASSGLSDYLVAGHSGLTVAPEDPVELAAAIDQLWNDPETAERLGKNGREFALAHCGEARTIGFVRDLTQRIRTTGRA